MSRNDVRHGPGIAARIKPAFKRAGEPLDVALFSHHGEYQIGDV